MDFHHVDVFADRPLAGNSLTVFLPEEPLPERQMLELTREFRHFESIFLWPTADPSRWRARVFDQAGELRFAGHPLLGAAAVLHELVAGERDRGEWRLVLGERTVTVSTERDAGALSAWLDQGAPTIAAPAEVAPVDSVLAGLGLDRTALDRRLEPRVVSTGLRYLILPIDANSLARARIQVGDFAERLGAVGAEFVYALDPDALEGRHWDNDGVLEDVATGSAAGTVGAYLAAAGRVATGDTFVLHQGRFVGRPSEIRVRAEGGPGAIASVTVGGRVVRVASGQLHPALFVAA